MKKLVLLMMSLGLVLSMVGCAAKEEQVEKKSRLEEIKDRGYLEVATEPYFAPYEFIDSSKQGDDKFVGCDMEIAKAIADDIGVELKIVPLEFSAVLASITDGKYDLAISALAYTPERAKNMEMSNSYYDDENSEGYGFLVKDENKNRFNTTESYEDAVIAVQSGSLQELLVNDQIPKCKQIKLVSSTTDGFLMVSEGKADAAATSIETAELYAKANGGVTIANEFRFAEDDRISGAKIGIPKGETELTDKVNEIIKKLQDEGKIEKWVDEYKEYAGKLGI